LLEARLDELCNARGNTDEHHQQITRYEDLKQKVEDFLAKAANYAVTKVDEPSVVKASASLLDGVKRIWAERHLHIADIGLLGTAAMVCRFTGPLPTVVAGTIVGGDKVADALKAAVELAKSPTEITFSIGTQAAHCFMRSCTHGSVKPTSKPINACAI
jgi:hypothetical protein